MKHDSLNGVMIDVRKIKQHPDNPRKALGDLTEATMSFYKTLERLGFQTDREVYDVLSGRSELFEEAKHEETD